MRSIPSRWLLLLCVLFAGFVGLNSSYSQNGKLIRVKGSNVMAGMCDAWAAEFNEKNPAVRVHVRGGGTAAGLEALFDKSAELAMASRRILEKELQEAAVSETKAVDMEVARTAVAIVTHPTNPIGELSVQQLAAILTGKTVKWDEVGGPKEPTFLIVSPPESGTSMFLRSALFPEDYFSSEANMRNYFHDILKEVALKKPPAIGYAGVFDAMKAARAGRVKILALKKDNESPAVAPSQESVKNGTYPLVMQLYFYWDGGRAQII